MARKKTSERLGELLEKALGVKFVEVNLYPATGWYRTDFHADVQRWTGDAKREDGLVYTFGCWDTMTACVKKGIVVDREDRSLYYQVSAK